MKKEQSAQEVFLNTLTKMGIKDKMEEMATAEEIEKMGYLNQEPN